MSISPLLPKVPVLSWSYVSKWSGLVVRETSGPPLPTCTGLQDQLRRCSCTAETEGVHITLHYKSVIYNCFYDCFILLLLLLLLLFKSVLALLVFKEGGGIHLGRFGCSSVPQSVGSCGCCCTCHSASVWYG